MANKKEYTKTEETFDLNLDHSDVVGMMNDADVLLNNGDVASDQTFQLLLKKSNGSEVLLKEMTSTDTLIFRFTKLSVDTQTADLGSIDVQP